MPGTSGSRQVDEILNRAQAAGTGMTYRAIAIRPQGPLMGARASGNGQLPNVTENFLSVPVRYLRVIRSAEGFGLLWMTVEVPSA
ncbi:hypothetical protein ABZV14_28800 [Streptosporangium canum]|uniref:hypothetical protein n=1 Tax=Streptosporangium canum TaxID=324952 RepID=UPI0033A48B78